MHYDIDLANIFHFHFEGKKECILFSQTETKYLYKIPHSLIVREDIDFSNPDLEKWPMLKKAKGYYTELEHGNVVYIPEGYWPKNLGKAIYNIAVMRHFDNLMRRLKGQKWIDWKNNRAVLRTHRNIQNVF